jgi:hypothetical protein
MFTGSDDLQFEAAAAGGIIEPDVELQGWEIPVLRAEVIHLRHDTERLARALEGVFPARAGLHDLPQRMNNEIDALAAWLDEVDASSDIR